MPKPKTYKEFVDKFKPKKTTDDCYTPQIVYEAVKGWAVKEQNWGGRPIVRPFWPGWDYKAYDYPENCVVIDNPPFSCISEIARFYKEKGIDYFLFAPALTIFAIQAAKSRICVGATVTYANGAKVATSFISSRGPLIRSAPELYRILKDADARNRRTEVSAALPKYSYPDNVITASAVGLMSKHEIDYQEDVGIFTSALDAQREKKKTIFGGGFIVPADAATKAQEAARKAKNIFVWELSEREVKELKELEDAASQKDGVFEH